MQKKKRPHSERKKKIVCRKRRKKKRPPLLHAEKEKTPRALSLSFQANTLAGVMIFAGGKGHKVTSCLFTTNDLSKAQVAFFPIGVVPLMCI